MSWKGQTPGCGDEHSRTLVGVDVQDPIPQARQDPILSATPDLTCPPTCLLWLPVELGFTAQLHHPVVQVQHHEVGVGFG